jgi:putative membrane protein
LTAAPAPPPAASRATATATVPLALLAAVTPVLVLTAIFCHAGRLNWFLEVVPALLGYVALATTYRRFRFTNFVYVCVLLHTLILVYGGYYTYAATPLGNWARDTFHLARNHYDRVGHLALGVFPVLIIKETLLRVTPLRRGGWLTFIVLSIVLAIGAFYELIEWWSTYLVAPDVGQAFLGGQGDPWDTQWDMLFDLLGGVLGLALLGRAHDRAMARLSSS